MASLSAKPASRNSPTAARNSSSLDCADAAGTHATTASSSDTSHCRPPNVPEFTKDSTPLVLTSLVVLARARFRLGVVVAALELHPVGLGILADRQKVGPRVSGHEAWRLPDHVELTVGADLTDIDGLRDVVIREHLRHATCQVRRLES